MFGYTVRLPDIEPFKGEHTPPQFTAKKVKKDIPIITKAFSEHLSKLFKSCLLDVSNNCLTNIYLRSQEVPFPLQLPVDRQCLIFDPRTIKPSSHINCTLFGNVVRLPIRDPLLGVLRAPQSFAVERM